MQLTRSTSIRQEMRQLLTPRMIQSMEILQLPLMALEERIEQEMETNPVLEMNQDDPEIEPGSDEGLGETPDRENLSEDERVLVVKENSDQAEDFNRLEKISDYLENEEFSTNTDSNYRKGGNAEGERDKKMDAMSNTAARGVSLAEHLMMQWAFIEAAPGVKRAGKAIINNLDDEGYL